MAIHAVRKLLETRIPSATSRHEGIRKEVPRLLNEGLVTTKFSRRTRLVSWFGKNGAKVTVKKPVRTPLRIQSDFQPWTQRCFRKPVEGARQAQETSP